MTRRRHPRRQLMADAARDAAIASLTLNTQATNNQLALYMADFTKAMAGAEAPPPASNSMVVSADAKSDSEQESETETE